MRHPLIRKTPRQVRGSINASAITISSTMSLSKLFIMARLVKHAPSFHKKNPTTSTWHHERISDHNLFNNESCKEVYYGSIGTTCATL
jgi:hypothetical protein